MELTILTVLFLIALVVGLCVSSGVRRGTGLVLALMFGTKGRDDF